MPTAPEPQYTEWLIRGLLYVAGVGSTVGGSWVSSKIRLYHDDKKSHHQDLKQKVLLPLRDLLVQHQRLFEHQTGVIAEVWGLLRTRDARPDQDAFVYGPLLQGSDPWADAFSAMDRALLEDARLVHYENLMAEIADLASSWKAYTESCATWVSEIGTQILEISKMNPYQPPCSPPFVNHLRLAVWIYRRLFSLPTNVLHQSNQGQYWSIEGAPNVPSVIGVSTVANEDQNAMLLEAVEKIRAANGERAVTLQSESKTIANRADRLRSKLEYEMAKKKLVRRCDLVNFFSGKN